MDVFVTTYFNHLRLKDISSDEKTKVVRELLQKDFKDIFQHIGNEEKESFYNITLLPDEIPNHSLFEDEDEIQTIIRDTVMVCYDELSRIGDLHVIVTPTFYSGYIQEMDGVMGFAPRSGNVIFITINTSLPDWRHTLQSTVAHEYHHTVIHENHDWDTFQDILVYEGLAEHFRNEVIGGAPSKWTVLNKTEREKLIQCWHYFENRLEKSAFEENSGYYEYFIGEDNDVPYQLGYSLGYIIVDDFLKESGHDIITATHTDPHIIIDWWNTYKNS